MTLGVLGILAALGLIPANAARARLLEARGQMEDGRAALLAGDAVKARDQFREAASSFIRAGTHARNPLLRIVSIIPIVGRNPDAVAAMSEAGRKVAEGSAEIAAGLSSLPDGLASLAPRDGAIPVGPIAQLAPRVRRAAVLASEAEAVIEATPSVGLIGPVADARLKFDRELAPLSKLLRSAAVLMEKLPAFLGADGPRRYFVGASNPAELRGTGGLLGAYAVLTVDGGNLSLSRFRPTQSLPQADPGEVEPPSRDFARRYPGAEGFWLNINLTPDFPTAAKAIENLYELGTAEKLDGTIVADPVALAALMRVVGPVEVPALGRTVGPDEVVRVISNEAYATLTDPEERKELLGDAAKAVLDRFLSGAGPPVEAARSVADAASAGHLMVHSRDPQVQEGLEAAGAAGRLIAPRGDFLSVVVNNGGGNKVDFYAERDVEYRVRLGAEGTALGEIDTEIRNRAPAVGQPAYVIGPYPGVSEAGENVSQVSAFVPERAQVLEARLDGKGSSWNEDTELAHRVAEQELRIPAGETGSASFSTGLRGAWFGTAGSGTYLLTVQGQPGLDPGELTVDVQVPAGTEVVRATRGTIVRGSRAVWSGQAPRELRLEIRFQKPLVPRLWEALERFFGKRVLTFPDSTP